MSMFIAFSQIMYPMALLFQPSAVMIEDSTSSRRFKLGFGLLPCFLRYFRSQSSLAVSLVFALVAAAIAKNER